MIDLYIKTFETVSENVNDEGEATYIIIGEYSLDGSDWIPCSMIWNGEISPPHLH